MDWQAFFTLRDEASDQHIGSPRHAGTRRAIAIAILTFFSTWIVVWAAFDLAHGPSAWRAGLDIMLIVVELLPHLWLGRRVVRWVIDHRRMRTCRCIACGYAVWGTWSPRCPECGRSPHAPLQ